MKGVNYGKSYFVCEGYWVITYEDPSRIGAVGSGLSLVPWQVGTFISKSSLR